MPAEGTASMTHNKLLLLGLAAVLNGCAADQYTGNIDCAQRPGCVSSFSDTGYGPVHSQAVAPDNPGKLQPQT
jgi:hypothetical protein